jgi:CRISPR-associated protein Cst1
MLRYTGHPLIDVGVATITAFSKKRRPQDVTEADLEMVAGYLKDIYCHYKPIQNFISSIFLNSHFVQPAKPVKAKEEYADQMLFAFRHDQIATEDDVRCTFFPEMSAALYAHRQHVPLLNGEAVRNFSAINTAGIPVSGLALLTIHAMPLGCFKCGHLLAFHQLADFSDPDAGRMTLVMAKRALDRNRQAVTLIESGSAEDKMPSYGSFYKTRYVDEILRALEDMRGRDVQPYNITGYYFTNYGPSPNMQVVGLNNAIFEFLDAARQDAGVTWAKVVYSGWQQPKGDTAAIADGESTQTWRNEVYEQLFQLPQNALRFIRLLRRGRNWQLIEIFLRKVLQMEQERIDTYRELGDRLAQYAIKHENQPISFYYSFSRAKDYARLRRVLQSAAERMLKASTDKPLFTYEEFIMAFEHPSEGYNQWRLGRDLIAIRMLEILHQNQISLEELPDDLEDESESEAE